MKGVDVFNWNEAREFSFQDLWSELIKLPILVAPNWYLPFKFHVDES